MTVVQLVRVTWNKLDSNSKKSFKSRNIQTAKYIVDVVALFLCMQFHRSAIVGSIVLFPLLGITWVIGIFAVSQKTTFFLWLFTICNSLQVM